MGHIGIVRCLKNFGKKFLASGSNDKTVILWDTKGVQKHVLTGHKSAVMSLECYANGSLLASGSSDGIRIWNINGDHLQFIVGHTMWVQTIKSCENLLMSGSFDGSLRFYDVSQNYVSSPRFFHSLDLKEKVVCLQMIGGNLLIVGTKLGNVIIYEINPNSQESLIKQIDDSNMTELNYKIEKIENSLDFVIDTMEDYKKQMSNSSIISDLQNENKKKLKKAKKLQLQFEGITEENRLLQQRLDEEQKKYEILQSKIDDEAKLVNCLICTTRRRSVLIIPCGHFIACTTCIEELQKRNQSCPICRNEISVVLYCKLS